MSIVQKQKNGGVYTTIDSFCAKAVDVNPGDRGIWTVIDKDNLKFTLTRGI